MLPGFIPTPVAAACIAVLPCTSAVSATDQLHSAVAADNSPSQNSASEPSLRVSDNGQIELVEAVTYIDSIPDEVLARGDEALKEWARTQSQEVVTAKSDIFGCGIAIGSAIASGALPVFKLTKIKKLIDGLGGIANAVKLIWQTGGPIGDVGGTLGDLLGEISGVKSIWENCFG